MTQPHKLSASALSAFLKSPKSYYHRYIARLEPIQPSVASYDHDRLCGIVWAQFVDRFYRHASEQDNMTATMAAWLEGTDGWVPEKAKDRLTKALQAWGASYHQMFNPDDGCRNGSELHLENERFVAYLDGLSREGVVHEVKSTSRSPQLSGQLWKVTNSIQVKLYCVLAKAKGICIEFAFKDPPYQLFRGPVTDVSETQRAGWEQELNTLADSIHALGDDEHNYPCHPDGCCLVTKGVTSMCAYHTLCDMGYDETTAIAYKTKESRK